MTNIISEFWEYVEKNKHKKIVNKIYNWLNQDNLSSIIVDKNVYWTELTSSNCHMPNYVYGYLKKWCNKRGLIYLYEL